MPKLNAKEYKYFEDIKHSEGGVEYWLARELAPVLGYVQWRNFQKVLDRAMLACKNSGYVVSGHFAEVGKMVEIGSKTSRTVKDYRLTRYACYLIVQNGDPRKEIIALGQTYYMGAASTTRMYAA
jgi:DNA-damage-inducible protein D